MGKKLFARCNKRNEFARGTSSAAHVGGIMKRGEARGSVREQDVDNNLRALRRDAIVVEGNVAQRFGRGEHGKAGSDALLAERIVAQIDGLERLTFEPLAQRRESLPQRNGVLRGGHCGWVLVSFTSRAVASRRPAMQSARSAVSTFCDHERTIRGSWRRDKQRVFQTTLRIY